MGRCREGSQRTGRYLIVRPDSVSSHDLTMVGIQITQSGATTSTYTNTYDQQLQAPLSFSSSEPRIHGQLEKGLSLTSHIRAHWCGCPDFEIARSTVGTSLRERILVSEQPVR